MNKPSTPYTVLGLLSNATEQEIRSAFRKKVKLYHPDLNNSIDASEKFREIYSAYELLKANNFTWSQGAITLSKDELERSYEDFLKRNPNLANYFGEDRIKGEFYWQILRNQ